MFLLPLHRDQLLPFLPKGGNVAEIGVAEGNFSSVILQATAPRQLHLIDPWEHQDTQGYARDPNNLADREQEARYRLVQERFRPQTESGQVVLHRARSSAAGPSFAAAHFDWIYIDGLHTYEGVTRDLEDWAPKVKEEGLILGHDYADHEAARQMQFGVVAAVDDYVRRSEFRFVALTNEAYPTYVLCRSAEVERRLLIDNLLLRVRGIVEISPFPGRPFQHRLVFHRGQALRYQEGDFLHLMSFSP